MQFLLQFESNYNLSRQQSCCIYSRIWMPCVPSLGCWNLINCVICLWKRFGALLFQPYSNCWVFCPTLTVQSPPPWNLSAPVVPFWIPILFRGIRHVVCNFPLVPVRHPSKISSIPCDLYKHLNGTTHKICLVYKTILCLGVLTWTPTIPS